MDNGNKKKLAGVIVPVVLAILVVCGFAVSGHITRNMDSEMPTAEPQTEEITTQQTTNAVSSVSLVAVGDNLIHNTLISAGEQEDGSLDYTSFYSNIENDISSADIAVINQETILGGSEFEYTGYPTFNSPWEIGTAAIDAGFDIFTCATNHSLDKGYSGIEQECLFFEQHPEVVHVGTNDSEEDYNSIVYYEKNGIRFAILNYTYGTNGIPIPESTPWCVNMMDEDKITGDVNTARQNADVVIVFPHWGTENSTSVSDYQREYVQLFSDLGVDIVIGTHPHVLQPVEWVENETTGKRMLVYYSLGNFISHQTSLNQLCGGMAKINIEKRNEEITITSASLIPVVCWYGSSGSGYDFSVYKLSDYTDELGDSHAQSGATPSYFTDYATDIVSEEFLDIG
ncbi:MAG TPA: CapA family protein [Candidatus Eubacterium faecipullorum]|mgnify:FL=1|uniref:CapA family protein n=1 Tax=Candidatus Eubacterium faecipullorum TaxID=2838571 RepID=A0A9D1RCX2_9FIRM|nr:CapA family protein [Candidatus Eubacterium faecipullorum]